MNIFLKILVVCIALTSCNQNSEIKNFFKYVESNSTKSEILDFKKISEDSIFFVHNEMIPKYINDSYHSYPNKIELSKELNLNFDVGFEYIEREILMMLFHLKLNGKRLSKNNLDIHWNHYTKTNETEDRHDSIKLSQFITKNYESHNIGDHIKVKFDVEKSQYDESRNMTYGSIYHMIHPKVKFEDSLVIIGKLKSKGIYPDFENKIDITKQLNSLMFEIEMTEINDTSISIAFTGPTKQLKIGELFYLDLEGYGCRQIEKINE